MSDTEDRIRWHLTESGWVRGGSVMYTWDEPVPPPPAGGLETWDVDYEVCSQYGTPVGAHARRVWPPRDAARPETAALWERFAPPWREFGTWYVEHP